MAERQIGHRKSSLVVSARFPVVKWRSRSVAKSARFMEGVDVRRRIFLSFKNPTPGKVAYIWHIERVQIDAIKLERTQIHFF